jgi:hypothetical protein
MKEFNSLFGIGQGITIRRKCERHMEYELIIHGKAYNTFTKEFAVWIGDTPYSLEGLFENFERRALNGTWVCFGMEEA